MAESLFFAGSAFAVLWILEVIKGAAIDGGRRVHLTAALICLTLAPTFWFGGTWLASAADPGFGRLVELAGMALAAAAALLALVELARWLAPEEGDEA